MLLIEYKPEDTRAMNVHQIARRIAMSAPELQNLTPAQLEAIGKAVIMQRLVRDMDTAVTIASIDLKSEKECFYRSLNSEHTRLGYRSALDRLEAYCKACGVEMLALTPAAADDYIVSMRGMRSTASVRRDVAAASSFYTWLSRRHNGVVSNPFRGTKARPKKESKKIVQFPSEKEVQIIMQSLSPQLSAIVACMAYRGLRVGALPFLHITGNRFISKSKGKSIGGVLAPEALYAIGRASLDKKDPFQDLTARKIELRIEYYLKKLYSENKISALYSSHDFRHFFAVTQYRKTRDIHRLSKLLGHASIQVTETYLKGLNEID